MPETATAEPPVTTPPPNEPLKSPMAPIFEAALKSQMPSPESAEPETVPIEIPPKTAAEPTVEKPVVPSTEKKPETPPAFELPPELTGDKPAATKETSVADLMPEEPPAVIRTEKGKADYKRWREHQLSLEKQLGQIREDLKSRPATGDADLLAQNELLKTRLTEMSAVVERAMLVQHPGFQNQFVNPLNAAVEAAKQLVAEAEVDPSLLVRALSATGKERRKAIDDLNENIESPTTKMELVDLMVKINSLEHERDAAMTDIKGSRERIDNQERASRHLAAQEERRHIEGMVGQAVDGLRDQAGFELLKKIDGNENWNTKVDTIVAGAKRLLTETTDPMEVAAYSVLGQLAPLYRTWALSEQKRRLAVEKENAELRGADPSLGDGDGAGAEVATGEERTGFAAIVDRALKPAT